MKTTTKYILASIALLALIIACTKEVGLYTEVEFEITEEHEVDGFISTPLATFLTITPEELLEDLSYSFSYKINSGAGYFEAVDGSIIQEGEKASFNPLSASLDYIPTAIGDHSVTFTASDTFGFTEEITLTYTITNIPVTWTAEGPTDPVLLGSSQSITVTLGNEAAVTGATYQRNYSFSEGSGNLYTAAPESNTITVNDFVSIEPGTYQLEYISNELGVTTIEFLLRDSNEQELIATVTFEVVDELSTEKEITSFIVNGVAGTITGTVIDVVLPEGTDLTALAPVIIHNGASISPESEISQDFTNPVIYTVTAQDETIQAYTVNCSIEGNDSKDITDFAINGVAGTITGTNISVTLPAGTDVTALEPTVTHTGATVSPVSDAAQDFTNSVIYTVTAEDASTQEYTVMVTVAPSDSKDITAFSIDGINGTITGTDISITLPSTTDVTALETTVTHTGATVSPVSGVAQDFTNPVIYTVSAEDASTQEYTITVTVAQSDSKDITTFTIDGVNGTITGTDITVILPSTTDVTALSPSITHTGASINPASGVAQDFTSPVEYTVTAADGTTQVYTITVSLAPALSSDKDITSFSIDGETVNNPATAFTITLPAGTDVTALSPSITHTGASINPASGVAQDFTSPVDYTVTAADGTAQVYTITVSLAPALSSDKDITSFTIDGETVNNPATAFTITLPAGTDVTALSPSITHTGASINPASGVAQDFTSPVEYTITAADGTTQVYTVTVNLAAPLSSTKDITSFSIDGETVNNPATAFTITLPAGTDVTALSPSIIHTGASINPASGVAQDFTSPVEYTVTAADGTTQVYTITVNLAAPLSSTKDITSFSIDGEMVNNPATAFTITLPAGTDVTALSPSIIHTGASINPASGVAQDFTSPVEYTVTAADGTAQMYTVTVNLAAPLSSTKDITTFSIDGVVVNDPATAFTITLPAGTDVAALSPIIVHEGNSINPASGVAQDFTSPVEYTVTAADGTTQVYTVTVNLAAPLSSTKDITTFSIDGVVVNDPATAFTITLPAGTDVAALSPIIVHEGNSINPASGVAQDFTSPVEYTVTAADGTTQVYTVTVNLAAPLSSTKDITTFSIDGVVVNDPATAFTITLPAGTDVAALSPIIVHEGNSINPASGVAQDFTSPVEYTVTAADGTAQVYTVTVNLAAPLSSTKDITLFTIDGETVNDPATAFTITLPAGTDVTALSPSITHTGASINPASGVVQDFSSPTTYTVTAADGTTQVYSVTVTAPALSSTKAITAFTIGGVNATISGTNISLILPAGTDVTALSPSITHTGTSINPASGAVQDFSSPVSYTVTAADGTIQVYSVIVTAPALSSTKAITAFTIGTVNGTITGTNISLTLPAGTDVTALTPSITHTGASINPDSGAAQDFSSPVSYTVTAADGTTQVYTVTVTAPALSSDKDITLFIIGTVNGTITGTNISLTLPAGTDVTALSPSITHIGVSINPASGVAQDFTSPMSYTVTAADGTTQVYSVTVTAPALSSDKDITLFIINGEVVNNPSSAFAITLPAGTDVTTLSPTIVHEGNSISPASEVPQDFTSPVSYTVTAADGTTQVYSVTVTAPALSSTKAITEFTIGTVNGTISGTNINLNLPAGTDVTALSPSITHTGASINPALGVAQNFSSPVSYTVTAADGTTQVYTVTVTAPALSSTKAITAFTIGGVNGTILGTNISVTLPAGTNVTSLIPNVTHTGISVSPLTNVSQNFTNPATYTVTAADGSTQVYTVTVSLEASTTKEITAFTIGGVNGTISGTNISVTLPAGTNVTSLIPNVTHTGISVNPLTNVGQNFTNPVAYTVTAADGSTQVYTVTVIAPAINNSPTANASGPATTTVGVVENFNANSSSDPDGNGLTYSWDFGDTNASNLINPTHSYATAGTYTVTLTVTDNGTPNLSDTATFSIDVYAVPPSVLTWDLSTGLLSGPPGTVVTVTISLFGFGNATFRSPGDTMVICDGTGCPYPATDSLTVTLDQYGRTFLSGSHTAVDNSVSICDIWFNSNAGFISETMENNTIPR
ncbi:beta strand repeat-containing protein [Cellulophaga sp. Asnod2-G02]|uniref:beta strand repeat-containing protein n=1 Tax=Cellulophaga sp. Asnod2-G02 TaxID=3160572 RepID=UPI00386452CA